ncbi:MAG TPA: helix-turn-helix domain-containing protein [Kofleriaceae bacterium]|nr:helix-turn-helix domain-containing protein [Kofleriaceae bacterium]
MERRTDRSDTAIPRSETVVDARTSLALWLRAGRMQRGLSLDAVAKVTKIQLRTLERLEAGRFDGLPAEVFVRGFVRSFARCVGLDEDEALRRYAACGTNGPVELTPTVRALVEAMVDLAPGNPTPRATPRRITAVTAVEVVDFDGDLAASSGSMAAQLGPEPGAVVETMMLPETGTLVMPVVAPVAEAPVVEAPVVEAPVVEAPVAVAAAEPAPIGDAPAAIEVVDVAADAASAEPAKRKRGRRGGKGRNKKASTRLATGTPPEASPVVTPALGVEAAPAAEDLAPIADEIPAALEAAPVAEAIAPVAEEISASPEIAPVIAPVIEAGDEPIATATWSPKMPPPATTASVPWRRPAYVTAVTAVVPSLVIDDADPDSAERVLEERAEKHTPRRSFLPPILLDREDRSGRQGGLTLAVIILLVAATLTLSYLMRRPGAPGDGMTVRDVPAQLDRLG